MEFVPVQEMDVHLMGNSLQKQVETLDHLVGKNLPLGKKHVLMGFVSAKEMVAHQMGIQNLMSP